MNDHALVESCSCRFEEVVAVTRDGTNDAPALHEADIGLAMGIAGTEVAKESAGVIVLDDNLSTIVTAAEWGRSILKFLQFQSTVYIVALVINFISTGLSGSAPLTAVQLLWLNLIIHTALALATEPPHDVLIKGRSVWRMGPVRAVESLCLGSLYALTVDRPVWRIESFIPMAKWRNIIGQSIYQLSVLVLNFLGEQILGLRGATESIIVVAVLGLPLPVTPSLAFAMKKLMNDHALQVTQPLVRQTANIYQVCTIAGSSQAPGMGSNSVRPMHQWCSNPIMTPW